MASGKVVTDGETKDEVDEVTDIKFESEDDDVGAEPRDVASPIFRTIRYRHR
jgi:hypothetical protein